MSSYEELAPYYDSLTTDVSYERFADFYEQIFNRYAVKPQTVLDLACGTGNMLEILASRGYDMIGLDASSEMLSEAANKDYTNAPSVPLLINQRMEELELYGTVDAAVCCLDGINYAEPDNLSEIFRRLRLSINSDGILIFDINTPHKLRNLDGEMFIDETEDVFCLWRTEYDEEINACYYGMDIFNKTGNLWRRSFEEHIEYAYEPEMLKNLLAENGFTNIEIFAELEFSAPRDDEERIFFAATRA